MDKPIQQLINEVKKNLSLKNYNEALNGLNLIIEKDKKNLSVLSTIGDIHVIKGNLTEAIKIFDKIIEINPKLAVTYNNKGFCLLRMKSYDKSILNFQKAIQYKKDYHEAYNNLGIALMKIGNNFEAKNNFLNAIKFKENYFQAYNNLGSIALEENNIKDAIKYSNKSIEYNKKNVEAYNTLGLIFKKKREFKKSLSYFNKALEVNENYLPALINLAKNYEEFNEIEKSIEFINKALEIQPQHINSLSSLIYLKLKLCDWENLEILKKKLFELCDSSENKIMQPYYSLLLRDDNFLQKKIAIKWSKKYTKKIDNEKFQFKERKKIKLGYFSSDFKGHAVATLIKSLFINHDKDKFELYGFNLSEKHLKANLDEKIVENFKDFFDCCEKEDFAIKRLCKSLSIDIAIDLNGYTKESRSSIFKNKCAPIQINYLGFPGTMGDEVYDYIVADKTVIPEEDIKNYSEKIIFMPDSFFPNSFENENLKSNLKRREFLLPNDKFIFCCFNNIIKMNEFIVDIWSEILNSSENSILWLSIPSNTKQNVNILNEFNKRKVDLSRIFFSDKIEYQKYLERFKLADLFLDTYPYCGHTTSIEALNAGLPVLTLQGNSFQNRVSASLLKNLDLNELITTNDKEYIKLALDLCRDREKLEFIKSKLINQKELSSIFNNQIYTKNLEKGYHEAYDQFVNQKKIDNIYLN